ncbi:CGNR zinc finger domain-containing protein [Streptomyces sp. NPDC005794]|uniref:CGNR zinc finger domain-containing protein n=1 Tax=Streptomyces sp. NPDC005794 TaxID=3364733 RepID=UPI0036CA05D9
MSWPATERYEIQAAPDGLAYVQDLLNTLSAGKPRETDLLLDRGTAQTWLDETWRHRSLHLSRPPVELGDEDVEQLRAFRDSLRERLAADTKAAEEDPEDIARPQADAALRLAPDGSVVAEPTGSGWHAVVSLVLIEMMNAQRTDQWRRLKVCRSERCRVTFFDRSRNNSAVWHDVRRCGHPANLRAYRARQRAQSHEQTTV